MTPDPATRPRQVTIGGSLAAVGGVILVLGLWDALDATASSELRRQLAEQLEQPPASGLGLGVDQALSLVRTLITVLAVAGGLATVFGVFSILGDTRARWGLLACGLVVFVGSPVTGVGLLGLGVTLGTIFVFSGPSRDWFAGRPIRTPPERPRREEAPGGQVQPPAGRPGAPSRPATGGTPLVVSPPTAAGATSPVATSAVRPRSVSEACVATWIGCLVGLLLSLVLLLVSVLFRGAAAEQLAREPQLTQLGLTVDQALTGMTVLAGVAIFWSLSAAALALGAWRGIPAAQTLLVVSSGVTIAAGLFTLPLGLVNAGLAAFVLARLLRSDARAWAKKAPNP